MPLAFRRANTGAGAISATDHFALRPRLSGASGASGAVDKLKLRCGATPPPLPQALIRVLRMRGVI
jgi:hypothetical protein